MSMNHLILIILAGLVILLITGCNQVPKKLEGNKLMVMDNFWKVLGGEKTVEEVKSESEKQ